MWIVLARLLTPDDFGIYALAFAATSFNHVHQGHGDHARPFSSWSPESAGTLVYMAIAVPRDQLRRWTTLVRRDNADAATETRSGGG
jgi:Polysaccharide biosynthesis protein